MGDSNFSNDKLSNIWEGIWESAKTVGRATTKVALELFYVMKSPDTGTMDKIIIGAALGYQFLDEDLIDRKEHPILGLLDNGVTLLVAYSRVQENITPEIEAHVEALLDKWFGTSDDGGDDDGNDGGSGQRSSDYYTEHPIEVIDSGRPNVTSNTNKPPRFEWNDDDIIVD